MQCSRIACCALSDSSKLPALITNALEGVELVGDERSRDLVPSIQPATEEDWSTEYLDLKMSVRIVDNIDEAITHINNNSTGHSEAYNKFQSNCDKRVCTTRRCSRRSSQYIY